MTHRSKTKPLYESITEVALTGVLVNSNVTFTPLTAQVMVASHVESCLQVARGIPRSPVGATFHSKPDQVQTRTVLGVSGVGMPVRSSSESTTVPVIPLTDVMFPPISALN